MIAFVLFWAAAGVVASAAPADTFRVVEGGYESVWEGHAYSQERFRWSNGDLDVCARLNLLEADVAIRVRDGADRDGLVYEAVFQLPDDDVRRLSVRVRGDTLLWGSEDTDVWIERRIDFDPSRPLLFYQSGIFSGYAQFASHADPAQDGSAQVLLVDGGVLGDWEVSRRGEAVSVTSPEDVTTILHGDGSSPPARIDIPEQEAEARRVGVERISTDEEFARCLELVDLPPPD